MAMEEQEGIITLTNENGEEIEYELVDSITYENAEYVVLLPVEDGDCEAVILAESGCLLLLYTFLFH